jgi:hypothetical protein
MFVFRRPSLLFFLYVVQGIKQCKNIFSEKVHSTKTSKTKKIQNTENQKDEQHGSHRKTGMNRGAGMMLK